MSRIDRWLHSTETGNAFTHCIHCRWPLLELDSPSLINKEFHREECTLEYAICVKCRDNVSSQFSEESKMAVQHFLENEIPWQQRLDEFMAEPTINPRFDKCIACGTARADCSRYASSILLDEGGQLVVGPLPLVICGTCGEKLQSRLSQATRDAWGRFMREHFSGPPEQSWLPGLL